MTVLQLQWKLRKALATLTCLAVGHKLTRPDFETRFELRKRCGRCYRWLE